MPTSSGLASAAPFRMSNDHMIPVEKGQAVNAGWFGRRPEGVTWHWGVVRNLDVLTAVIGGAHAERRGKASAHYGIGRSFREGVHRYVSLENGSWHAGKHQTLRWDGLPLVSQSDKATRSCIGIETATMGETPDGGPHAGYSIRAASPLGKTMWIQPWTEEQVTMCVAVGVEIVARWPHIGPTRHHGHHDLCPTDPNENTYKVDVIGFPFARILRGIYPNVVIPDVWTPLLTQVQRQRALLVAGYDLGRADGVWGPKSRAALLAFQRARGMVPNGCWSTFVSRRLYDTLAAKRINLADAAGAP